MNIERALVRYKNYGENISIIERDTKISSNHNFISAIVGPRRAGKTLFMIQLMKELNIPESNKIFINGEDIDFEGISTSDLDKIEDMINKVYQVDSSNPIWLFIDEVQRFPSWSRWVRTLNDENLYHIVISGSTSELSTEKLPTELRGRALNTMILPFSFSEVLKANEIAFNKYPNSEKIGKIMEKFDEFLRYGGYPQVVLEKNAKLKTKILEELLETVMQRDIIERKHVKNVRLLKAFMSAAIGSACRPISYISLSNWLTSNMLRVSKQTAINYISYAEEVFLFFQVFPFSDKPKMRNLNPKIYLSDSGLLGLISDDKAKQLENQVFIELIRRGNKVSYYTDGKSEIDFVVSDNKKVNELIQVSLSLKDPSTYERETKSMIDAAKKLRCKNLIIITENEERSIKVKGKTIKVVPAWKWMLKI
ncbi:MAG: ATP-binding protein [Candidatus Acidifodinimicrobium sp.]